MAPRHLDEFDVIGPRHSLPMAQGKCLDRLCQRPCHLQQHASEALFVVILASDRYTTRVEGVHDDVYTISSVFT